MKVDETYRKINRFDDLDIFSRARLMNTGEYDEYLQEREIETYKQALLDIKVLIQNYGNEEKILNIINKALGDKENE